ncbi:hypothetical protein ES703_98977 [subsurface metagenome]
MAVDNRQDLLGLLGRALALGLVGDDAGQINRIAVHHHLAHAWTGFETLNAHIFFSPREWRACPSVPWHFPPLHSGDGTAFFMQESLAEARSHLYSAN